MKGKYAREGGFVNRGFEGGQSALHKRFPQRGFKPNKFNIKKPLEQLNLGKLAYHIQKGQIDATKPITMKELFESGCLTKIQYGVKILCRGAEQIKELGIPITLEVSDATKGAIEAIKETGGAIKVQYRTPLLMRYLLKPHKFSDHKTLKTPMPAQKKLLKLEKLREKGLEVDYPRTPWYTDNKEAILADATERDRRISEAQFAELLPTLPADRSEGASKGKPRVEKKELPRIYKFPI